MIPAEGFQPSNEKKLHGLGFCALQLLAPSVIMSGTIARVPQPCGRASRWRSARSGSLGALLQGGVHGLKALPRRFKQPLAKERK